jgi:hypothetical protein
MHALQIEAWKQPINLLKEIHGVGTYTTPCKQLHSSVPCSVPVLTNGKRKAVVQQRLLLLAPPPLLRSAGTAWRLNGVRRACSARGSSARLLTRRARAGDDEAEEQPQPGRAADAAAGQRGVRGAPARAAGRAPQAPPAHARVHAPPGARAADARRAKAGAPGWPRAHRGRGPGSCGRARAALRTPV